MKYLCLVHFAPEVLSALSPAAKQALDARSLAYDAELAADGHLVVAEALESPRSGVLVKVRDGKISTTHGPIVEAREPLGGFLLIDAPDLNAAIRVAAGIPLAELGTIELRPIYQVVVSKKRSAESALR